MRVTFLTTILKFTLVLTFFLPFTDAAYAGPADEPAVNDYLKELFENRAQLLLDGNPAHLQTHYVMGQRASKYAFDHEMRRARYLEYWSKYRHLKLKDAQTSIKVVRVRQTEHNTKVSLVQSMKLTYQYENDQAEHSFGVGTRHFLTLKKTQENHWYVDREWYSDPLEENPELIEKSTSTFAEPVHGRIPASRGKGKTGYRRERAVAYANKYAGLAWGAGNNHRYNSKYLDYTPKGGDCTNFSSQALGDPAEGGGLRMTGEWRYRGGGSKAWVHTDSFKGFLMYSGYGRLLAQGSYHDMVQYTRSPKGAEHPLEAGDLIAYVLNGDIDHFCVVVGFDPKGYPLVNSHTADRYAVPFDLGWDKKTLYQWIHIRD
ncbi:amidase domain-containing protein [Paenibacillus sp. JX-17]|uniref:Amidase domain-containing protein n=1 Tax=Paenibacillus lacisoli TaxID=3064525 RepID=A0ABT9CA46_9BACL|nr:amidase domain-containing protein [Paenibacillus sp. JX-17]MDO7906134.1 amidase domain-containing protein [Paenibacillus sp. JX-17]